MSSVFGIVFSSISVVVVYSKVFYSALFTFAKLRKYILKG